MQHRQGGIELAIIELVGQPFPEEVGLLGLTWTFSASRLGIVEEAAPGGAVAVEDDRPLGLSRGHEESVGTGREGSPSISTSWEKVMVVFWFAPARHGIFSAVPNPG